MNDLSQAPAALAQRPGQRVWPLTVVEAFDITPRVRRLRAVSDLDGFSYRPGQSLVLTLPQVRGEPALRHYTIRSYDPVEQRLDIDFVLHGDSPAVRFVRAAALGDRLTAQGPRGRIVVNPAADWHLFVGDETCLPAILAMVESLPAKVRAFVIVEVHDAAERQAVTSAAHVEVEWFHRGGPARPLSPLLIERLSVFAFPPGVGQAYVIGETSAVRAIRQNLIARGFPREMIAAEGYWRPGRIGRHDHILDPEDLPHALARRFFR